MVMVTFTCKLNSFRYRYYSRELYWCVCIILTCRDNSITKCL